ncbi:PP2C family serine/threonine-protein phosphatase [Streptomyces sp. NPDC093252]|uniref:PP2C family serine/threonine-protein phosphatase n=1 Tax=Streptomyces sp. NPDC093252 TaxID=3154980 RepID=UPI00343D5040
MTQKPPQTPHTPPQAAVSHCPSCAEPLESGDRFCGACGYDLSAVPLRPDEHPTLTLGAPAPPPPPGPPPAPEEPPGWPAAAPGSSGSQATHLPTDLRGTDSGGIPLPERGAPPGASAAAPLGAVPPQGPRAVPDGGQPAPGVRFDRRAGAPEPHSSAPAAASVPPPPSSPPPAQPPSGPPASGPLSAGPPSHEPDEYPLQAPDPRIAEPQQTPSGAGAGGGVPVCVACRAGRVDSDGYCENCGHAQPRERDHMERESGPVAAVSDRGLRHHRNEDAFTVAHTALPDGSPAVLAIVCDGVSSATRPDDASLAASRAAGDSLLAALPAGTHPQQAMHDAIVAASLAVNSLANEPATAREQAPHQNAPACTLVGAIVTGGLLVVGWVGDSRAYWIPADRTSPPARLTEDDSWAAQMVAAGLMNEAEAYADERAHAITGWLGADAYELEPHTASFKPDRPGVVIVCTDGLWNYAEGAEEMARTVPVDAAVRPLHSARVLVGHALDGGGHDNVTVAVLPFPAVPQGAGSA